MSNLNGWVAKFYRKDAEDFCDKTPSFKNLYQAINHSIRKWKGLREENLSKYGLVKVEDSNAIAENGLIISDHFAVDSRSCALCQIANDCEKCPLFHVRGEISCDEFSYKRDKRSGRSPYFYFRDTGDPEPMIEELEASKKWLIKRHEKGRIFK